MRKVLIADDEPEIVEMLMTVLGDWLQSAAAYDGVEALRVVRDDLPDLVIADVMMPLLDGRQLCERIKADPDTQHIKVVLMSTTPKLDLASCQPDELLFKPFDLDAVEPMLHELLAGRPENGK